MRHCVSDLPCLLSYVSQTKRHKERDARRRAPQAFDASLPKFPPNLSGSPWAPWALGVDVVPPDFDSGDGRRGDRRGGRGSRMGDVDPNKRLRRAAEENNAEVAGDFGGGGAGLRKMGQVVPSRARHQPNFCRSCTAVGKLQPSPGRDRTERRS